MTSFKAKPSPAYKNAVRVLAALDGDDIEDVCRASAEVLAPARIESLRARGYKRSTGYPCIERLHNRHCWHYGECPRPPGTDHAYIMLRDGKPWAYVFEPYDLSLDTLRELVAFCDEHGLNMNIRADWATHFPGATVAVVLQVRRKDSFHDDGLEERGLCCVRLRRDGNCGAFSATWRRRTGWPAWLWSIGPGNGRDDSHYRSRHDARTSDAEGVAVSRSLVRLLADMVEAALDRRTVMRYASSHEEAMPDMQDDVREPDDVAAVLQRGVQAKSTSDAVPESE